MLNLNYKYEGLTMDSDTSTSKMNWDLSSYFPEFNGSEMIAFKEKLKSDIDETRDNASKLEHITVENQDKWEVIFLRYEELDSRYSHLSSYIGCLSSADAYNEQFLKEEADIIVLGADFSKLKNEMLRCLQKADLELVNEFSGKKELSLAKHYINRLYEESKFRMSMEMEKLSADLGINGISAWSRLYDTVSGKLEFEMEYPDGKKEILPISQRRSLMENPDRGLRKAAFVCGNKAWEKVEDIAASAINAISGTRLTLNNYRKIDHFLDVALFQSSITKKTLEAMFEAAYSEIELPKKILRLKASTMERDQIAWFDLGAPLDIEQEDNLDWERAKELVSSSFSNAYPRLGEFIDDVYRKNWIDWEPRMGKRPGGFCTGSLLNKESRIFLTYNNTIGDVLTLAHEAGHAFHSHVMRDIRPFAHNYPMTLAESASTFAEMILSEGLISDKNIKDEQKALILDMEINHGAVYLMDIPVRFEFEKKLYELRQNGELTVSKLKELMVETQRQIFGDILEEGGEDPYFWASKLHFYITGVTFYNFPYTFGYLLSRGLFSIFKQEGREFLNKYEEFLRLSGSDTAENVAKKTIGKDLTKPDFWIDAIRTLEKPYQEFSEILKKLN